MAAIPASLVKQLREQTGAGMMDCKRALEETGGEVEPAVRLLRERGIASAGKRAGRATKEGVVLVSVDGDRGAIVAVGCETEPVSKNSDFVGFAQKALETVEREGADAVAGLEDERVELAAKVGENLVVVGAARMQAGPGELLASYVHPPANKIGVLLRARGSDAEAARRLAMHVSFAAPQYGTREEVPAAEVEAEREILLKRPDVSSKPEQVREKIVEGMLAKNFFGVTVLADQQWIHDTGRTVRQALSEAGLEALEFVRYRLGE